jgi:hypothetical protein
MRGVGWRPASSQASVVPGGKRNLDDLREQDVTGEETKMSDDETRGRRVSPPDGKRELTPNPYFGAGLAVHRYLRVCRRCPWAGIVRENPHLLTAPVALPPEATERTIAQPPRRFKRPRA